MEKQQESNGVKTCDEDTSVDWRGRPSHPINHGGTPAAAFLLGLQGFEIMAIAAVGNNLITYLINEMHFSLSKSANTVTNFIGTVFLLALLGGYLSDSYLGCFWTILIFGLLELSGFVLLSVQAHLPRLKPPPGEEAEGLQAVIFFAALYLVALGSGCVKPNMIAHGAHQFQNRPDKLSTYFNAAYFAFSVGELVALTVLVYVQTHAGMDVGFGVSAAAMAVGIICFVSGTALYRNNPPRPAVFTPIAQVVVAAIMKRKAVCPSDHSISSPLQLTHTFRFLNKACIRTEAAKESKWRLCTAEQVEQVKTLISVIPIFASTIIFNTILAQLQTFSVHQASSMNTHLTPSFPIPPASLQAIPYLLLLFLLPLYHAFARTFSAGIAPLHRIGAGLFFATFSMVAAALMERRRRNSGHTLSFLWITPQFLIFGVSEMLTAVGLVEFFYRQSVEGMQAFLTAMTYCSYSFGFYLSSVLVTVVNRATSRYSEGGGGWLGDDDLDKDRLDLFYWLLAGLSFVNFLNYLFWSRWYSRIRRGDTSPSPGRESVAGRKLEGDDKIHTVV